MTKKTIDPSVSGQIAQVHFNVGDRVEVFCDHDEDGRRVRDWIQGVVVQAEEKRVAVQFVIDVYLTDGWMVPDRVLWCPQGSANIRPTGRRRTAKRQTAKKK